jgi:hypothetical protein
MRTNQTTGKNAGVGNPLKPGVDHVDFVRRAGRTMEDQHNAAIDRMRGPRPKGNTISPDRLMPK